MKLFGQRPAFTSEPQHLTQFLYRMEESRGYDSQGDLWSPGYFRVGSRSRVKNVALVASTESWETILALTPDDVIQAETERRAAAARRGQDRSRIPRWRANWCWPPINSSSCPWAACRTPPARRPPATKCAPSSPAIIGSPIGAATR